MLYLVRYSEIALKGKNRQAFENQLANNIKAFLKAQSLSTSIKRLPGRLLLETKPGVDLRPVFGIASFSPCVRVKAELEILCSEALRTAQKHTKTTTFRLTAKRSTKSFFMTSPQLNDKIGAFIVKSTGMKVSLKNPGLEIGIDIIGGSAYVYEQSTNCFGGLPVGIEGKVLVLFSGKKSALAALLMAKRGCALELAAYQGDEEPDYSLLQLFSPVRLRLHKIKQVSELESLAHKLGCKALVVPDTLEDVKGYSVDVPVLRPLIAFSERELLAEQKKYASIL